MGLEAFVSLHLPIVLKKFSLKVSWVYLKIRQVFPTAVSPMITNFINASKVSGRFTAIAPIWILLLCYKGVLHLGSVVAARKGGVAA